jgi:MoaA/NifB/PqqE/SkfB family radical SAM enzyme
MSLPLVMPPPAGHAPVAPFLRFTTLWIQITGTWCNLECVHCINASGPKEPWLRPLRAEVARAAIREAEELGVKEIYFTGGEPFLHGDILSLLALALQTAPTTVLTNGTLIDAAMADELAALAASAPYSLEIRVSLDDTDREKNDRIRGAGAFAKAIDAIQSHSTSNPTSARSPIAHRPGPILWSTASHKARQVLRPVAATSSTARVSEA